MADIKSKMLKFFGKKYLYKASDSIEWLGNEYGGFFADTSLLTFDSILFSFGVGEDISFDLAIAKYGIKQIFLFDPTPKSESFIIQQNLPPKFQFLKVGLSDNNEETIFYLPKNDSFVSGSLTINKNINIQKSIYVEVKKLSTIQNELEISNIDILKMDIEGSEYRVIKNLLFEDIHPKQICVEFHNNFFTNGKALFNETIFLLEKNNYKINAVSITGKEYLFVKRN